MVPISPDRRSAARQGGRDAVLDAAVGQFARAGFAGTSMRDIAAAARCSIANLYHYFVGKEALWLAILERALGDMPARLSQAMADANDPAERFDALVRAHLGVSATCLAELRILLVDGEALSDHGNAANRALQREILALYVTALGALASAGVKVPGDARIAALNVLGVVNWHLRWTKADATVDRREIETDAIVAFVRRAVGLPAMA